MARNSGRFRFDGGAGTYLGTGILAFLVTLCTLGICFPFALVLRQRWRAKHTLIDNQRLVFMGSAWGLFGNWIKWFLLCVITLGIYSFWVAPRVQRWIVENTDFDTTAEYRAPQQGLSGNVHVGGPALGGTPSAATPALEGAPQSETVDAPAVR